MGPPVQPELGQCVHCRPGPQPRGPPVNLRTKQPLTSKHGKGKDPYLHRGGGPRRLWQVYNHWPSYLQMWWH